MVPLAMASEERSACQSMFSQAYQNGGDMKAVFELHADICKFFLMPSGWRIIDALKDREMSASD